MAATPLLAGGTAGVEGLGGTDGPDNLSGTTGDDSVVGLDGRDFLAGDATLLGPGGDDGDDTVDGGSPFHSFGDATYGGDGIAIMDAFRLPAVADVVVCGPGKSSSTKPDGADIIADDCEAIVRGPQPDPRDPALLDAIR